MYIYTYIYNIQSDTEQEIPNYNSISPEDVNNNLDHDFFYFTYLKA